MCAMAFLLIIGLIVGGFMLGRADRSWAECWDAPAPRASRSPALRPGVRRASWADLWAGHSACI